MAGKEEKIVISLNGGGPWGFRLQGGVGTGLPLTVSKVRRKSKAYRRLREGDRIVSVNGRTCDGLTYDQLMEIADKCGTDLNLEVLRNECNKENKAPQPQQQSVKPTRETESTTMPREMASFTETSTKVTEEKEGLRIQSATMMSDPGKAFESFKSTKLEEVPAVEKVAESQLVEPFPSFKDLQLSPAAEFSSSSKQETASGDDKNFTKMKLETKHEVKGNTETSFLRKEEESFSKTTSDSHGMPGITMDTIDLNNLISEAQKRLEGFKQNFKSDGYTGSVDRSVSEIKKTEIIKSTTSETKKLETTSNIADLKNAITAQNISFGSANHVLGQKVNVESAGLDKSVVSKQTDSVKNSPLITVPKLPKVETSSGLDAFKDCLKEMEMLQDPILTLPDLGFTDQVSETSTVITDIPFGTATTVTKKKKMFSSSSFYEEPDALYPTMEEQFQMARKIASSLADDTNKKSKGSNMFYKRVKRSTKWIHEGPEPSDESGPGTPEIYGVEPPTPDPSQVPFKPSMGPPKLKLVLDPRHAVDLNTLRSSGNVISEHNVISPDVCHGLVKDLHSPVGKGAALFAKRKKKSEEWVVDEEKVKTLLREQESKKMFAAPPLNTNLAMYSGLGRQDVRLVKSPWDAAMENPYGFCDSAFSRINPDHLADTVIRAAETKRAESLSREPSRMEGCISPPPLTPAGAMYDVYHAKHPKGWPASSANVDYTPSAAQAMSPAPSFVPQPTANVQNGFHVKKMVFQNFNTVPRCWKGASVH